MFTGAGGGPLNPTTVWTWVRTVAASAGLPSVPTHVLRHTCLTTALEATGDLRAVQEFAGHARPETTAGYTRTSKRRLEAAVASICYDLDESLGTPGGGHPGSPRVTPGHPISQAPER